MTTTINAVHDWHTCRICGGPMSPGATAGGHVTHPGCDPANNQPIRQWACIDCHMTGVAIDYAHALAVISAHNAYACPYRAASDTDLTHRLQRRKPLSELYPAEVPWMHAERDSSGRLQPVFGTGVTP